MRKRFVPQLHERLREVAVELRQMVDGEMGSPAWERRTLRVPALAVRVNGQLELFEEDHFLEAGWELTDCDATLSGKRSRIGDRLIFRPKMRRS